MFGLSVLYIFLVMTSYFTGVNTHVLQRCSHSLIIRHITLFPSQVNSVIIVTEGFCGHDISFPWVNMSWPRQKNVNQTESLSGHRILHILYLMGYICICHMTHDIFIYIYTVFLTQSPSMNSSEWELGKEQSLLSHTINYTHNTLQI